MNQNLRVNKTNFHMKGFRIRTRFETARGEMQLGNRLLKKGICMMTSFDYNYQNALREAVVFSIFSFVKNRSCMTQKTACILVVCMTSQPSSIDPPGCHGNAVHRGTSQQTSVSRE